MKAIILIVSVLSALAQSAHTNNGWKPDQSRFHRRGYSSRRANTNDSVNVPEYKFTMPVDHFSSTNKQTYLNKYYVNDTYYRPGGPVIFYDNGEAGFDADSAASTLAEANGPTLPMQLAANLSGLVIGWEHRYYGDSRPVPMVNASGLPVEGSKGYIYLSVEQALEDVAYFASNFNSTKLDKNALVKNTVGLDPYSTPWVFIGASYPGSRAAWMRLRHPEIIYASWASSAPLQYQFDGSPYYNPVVRSMAANCTNDIKAAIKYVDTVFDSGSADAVTRVKIGALLVASTNLTQFHIRDAADLSEFDAAGNLASGITLEAAFQNSGPVHTTQVMCDKMESFDVKAYTAALASATQDSEWVELLLNNTGASSTSDKGIALSNGNNGGQYAFAALLYGIVSARASYNEFIGTTGSSDDSSSSIVDTMSWSWQSLSEVGIFQGSNPDNITVVSKRDNSTAVRDILYKREMFNAFEESDFPTSLNNTGLLNMGGWSMTASNVMFTNGEFDPWRAFSVASQEEGAPKRNIVRTVPKCNEILPPGDVFGLTYLGAVHGEDINQDSTSSATLIDGKNPQQQGLELFLQAWSVWAPCFNQSRDSIRNGKGVDGKGHNASGNLTTSGPGSVGSGKGKSGDANSDVDRSIPNITGISVILLVTALFTIWH